MKKIIYLICFLLILGSTASAESTDKSHKVLTTTGMVADIVRNLAEPFVELEFLMGPGIDPHAYRATHGDIRKLKEADIVFYNGLALEGKMEDIFKKLSKKKRIVAIADSIPKAHLLAAEDYQDAYDPHIWFDISLWIEAVRNVEKALVEALPNNKVEIEKRSSAYRESLIELDKWAKNQIAQIPEKRRVLITAHDAFRYFGRRYGIEVMGLQGISSATDYGLRDIKRLSDIIIERDVSAIFVESSVPPKFIESLREAVLAKGHNVDLGGNLYSDAMGAKGSGADNFIAMFKHNVKTVTGALK